MIFRYSLFFCALFLYTCTSVKEEGPFTKQEVKQSVFQAVRGDSLEKLLVEQFCEESKGYQENTWLGLNQCAWAIEKFRLGQYPEIIQRTENQLTIQLVNGKQKVFMHRDLDTNAPTYFQFKRKKKKNGLVLLEQMNNNVCTQHLFIRLSDGQQTVVSGVPYLAINENGFILNGGTETCRSTLEYWTLADGQVKQKWTQPLSSGKIKELRWMDNDHFVVQSGARYAKYTLH